MTLIRTEKIMKTFYQGEIAVHALQGIDLVIEKGEFTALVGPSASGKTTLLNIIGALDRQTSGEIFVGKQNLKELNSTQLSDFRLHNIGFVFQAYNLIPVLTALENVEYILMISGVNKNKRLEKSRSILSDVGLSDVMDRFPGQLSGGQQQRVAVARALVSEPEIVLADEPTANLDSENADMLLQIMKKMCEDKKTTFLFSTHDTRVMDMARRLVKLRDGKIVE